MYEGYLRFGTVELVNHERLKAYISAGCAPAAGTFDVPGACDGLGAALQDPEYVNPVADEAPWYDAQQPETHWFGGVQVLDVTGLEGSTLVSEISEKLGDGGVPISTRHTSRTIAVSALLVGRDDESVHAGLEWLTQSLHRGCSSAADCGGTTLEAFTTCPAPVMETEDLNADLIAHDADPDESGWLAFGGRWEAADETFLTNESAEPGEPQVIFIGGTPYTTSWDDELFGGTPYTDDWEELVEGGTPEPITRVGRLGGPFQLGCLSEVVARWTVTGLDDTVRVAVGAIDENGLLLDRDEWFLVDDFGDTVTFTYRVDQAPWEEWYPAIWVSEPGAELQLEVSYRPDLDPDDCLRPYQRIFQDVTCVAGPTVVAKHKMDDCSTLLQVEWTWVAGDAYRYQLPVQLVAGLRSDGVGLPTVIEPGVSTLFPGPVDAEATECDAPEPPADCSIDPLYPTFAAPPAAPKVPDPGAPAPASYTRSVVQLDPEVVPTTGVGALRFTFTNGATTKRGVRVRLWEAESPDFESVPECEFVSEFTIRYLDGDGAQMLVDGPAGTVTIVCLDGSLVNGSGAVRGAYGGAFDFPEVRCDRRYFIAVDVPTGTGRVDWGVSLSVREG